MSDQSNNPFGSNPEQGYDRPSDQQPAYNPYAPPTAPQPPYGQPPYGQPSGQQPQYGQSPYGPPSGQQPQYGQSPYGPPSGQQPQYGQPQYGQPSGQQPQYGQSPYGPPSGQQPQYGPPSGQQPQYGAMPYNPQVYAPYNVPGAYGANSLLATPGKRFASLVVDWLLFAVLSLIVGIVINPSGARVSSFWSTLVAAGSNANIVYNFMILLLWSAYYLYFYSTTGQTLGKRLMKIKVIRRDLQPLSLQTGLRRLLGIGLYKYIAFIVVILSRFTSGIMWVGVVALFGGLYTLLDYAWVLWDSEQQTLHDKIADTLVVNA